MPQSDSKSQYRVVVVGAGLAGLTAAHELVASGRVPATDVLVLEGAGRVGGRIETRKFSEALPMNVEIGAAWIHGTQGNPFAALAAKFGIQWKEIAPRNPWLHPGAVDNFLMFDGGERLSEADVKETWVWQQLLMDKLQALANAEGDAAPGDKPLSVIVDELATQDAELAPLVSASATGRKRLELCVRQIEIWMGATAAELLIDDFADTELIGDDPGPHCIVPAGMERFIDGLAAPVKDCIRTNTRVTSINYDASDKVVIETEQGETIEAEYVVVTSSLGYLKSNQLKFQPELPADKADAIKRSKMGQYMKVLVQFPSVFWPEDAVFIGQLTDSSANKSASAADSTEKRVYFPAIFNYYFAKGAPVLEAQIVGTKAEELSATMTDEEIVRAMYLQLQETFGADIPAPVGHLITRWDQDKWAIGAYSTLTLDSTEEDPEILQRPIGKRVYFAGEAHNFKYQGGLQAAAVTGHEAAENILGSL